MKKTYYERTMAYFSKLEDSLFKNIRETMGIHIVPLQEFFDNIIQHMDSYPDFKNFFESIRYADESSFNVTMQIIYQLYYFWSYDKTVYRVSDEIINALISTDVDDMNVSMLLMPTPNLYLSFTNKFFTLRDPNTGIHQVSGLFLTSEEDDEYKYWRVLVVGENNVNSEHALDDSIFFYKLKLRKDMTIAKGLTIDGDHTWQMEELNDIFTEQITSTFKFLCNIILYLNYSGKEKKYTRNNIPSRNVIKNPKKLRRYDKQYGDMSSLHFFDIRDEALGNIFEREDPGSGTITDMIRWKSAWLVRGHWHRYWIGKGRSELDIKWLQPYWKGEDKMEIKGAT